MDPQSSTYSRSDAGLAGLLVAAPAAPGRLPSTTRDTARSIPRKGKPLALMLRSPAIDRRRQPTANAKSGQPMPGMALTAPDCAGLHRGRSVIDSADSPPG